jgi:hypothetical protein
MFLSPQTNPPAFPVVFYQGQVFLTLIIAFIHLLSQPIQSVFGRFFVAFVKLMKEQRKANKANNKDYLKNLRRMKLSEPVI